MKHLILTLTLYSAAVGSSFANSLSCEKHIASAAQRHDVPFPLLYAVGLAESGHGGRLHPYALNVEGRTFFPGSKQDAILIFKRELARGRKLIDLGCMQINHKYHASEFSSLDAMLSPRQNVDYSARFLRRLRDRHGSWSVAIARYHAGDKNHSAQKKYVCRVLRHMIAQNLATNTNSAKKICKSIN